MARKKTVKSETTDLAQPQNRTEEFLAKIAGLVGTLPQGEFSRLERYLKYIAENGGGGGGVTSFNTRTGAVTPKSGDYSEFYALSGSQPPIGEVIFFAGTTAPTNYLACDGSVHNISDYTGLANFIQTNYGSKNYFGGDGTTTFGVPDWRGEFFRASGTNAHTGEGNGANVGVHQDGTQIPWYWAEFNSSSDLKFGANFNQDSQYNTVTEVDKTVYSSQNRYRGSVSMSGALYDDKTIAAKVRPTNTSLLVCIRAK